MLNHHFISNKADMIHQKNTCYALLLTVTLVSFSVLASWVTSNDLLLFML